MEIKVTWSGVKELMEGIKRAPQVAVKEISKAVEKSTIIIKQEAVHEAPVAKGGHEHGEKNLRTSIVNRMITRLRGEIESMAPYSFWVHEGTRPSPGRFVPGLGKDGKGRRLVNGPNIGMHPGQTKNPFLQRAIDKTADKREGFFKTAIQNIFNTFK